MYCPSCGVKSPGDAKFCPSCGKSMSQAQTTSQRMASNRNSARQQPEKKKMALWKKIGIGVVVVIGSIVGLALFLTAGLVEPIDRQIEALSKGDIATAYAQTSIGFKDNTTQQAFATWVKRHPVLAQVKDRTFTDRSRKKGIGTLKGTITGKDGRIVPITYKLVKENGEWKILSIKIVNR